MLIILNIQNKLSRFDETIKTEKMSSEDYKIILINEYDEKNLTKEDFESTLMHFAKLYHKEKTIKKSKKCQKTK